jgi:hypothetical protein
VDERTDRQAGRHDEANSRFLQFCERAYNGHEVDTGVTEWLINLERSCLLPGNG